MIKGELQADGPSRPLGAMPRLHLDTVDKRIVAMLQVDGRRTHASMAHRLGLPEAEVERRVEELVDSGVIQIAAVSDPVRLGLTAQTMLGVLCGPGMARVLAEKLADRGEFVYIVLTAGSFDLMTEVYGRDEAHLADLITELTEMPGVTTVQAYPYADVQKQIYTWGVF